MAVIDRLLSWRHLVRFSEPPVENASQLFWDQEQVWMACGMPVTP
jgi:hypothetical protein